MAHPGGSRGAAPSTIPPLPCRMDMARDGGSAHSVSTRAQAAAVPNSKVTGGLRCTPVLPEGVSQ